MINIWTDVPTWTLTTEVSKMTFQIFYIISKNANMYTCCTAHIIYRLMSPSQKIFCKWKKYMKIFLAHHRNMEAARCLKVKALWLSQERGQRSTCKLQRSWLITMMISMVATLVPGTAAAASRWSPKSKSSRWTIDPPPIALFAAAAAAKAV